MIVSIQIKTREKKPKVRTVRSESSVTQTEILNPKIKEDE